jgi:DNA-binding NtrC family response regulator
VRITLPALKDRLEDIPLLLIHFLSDLARQYNRPMPEIDGNVHEFLAEQPWPGNVRQLRHVVERAFVFSENGRLRVSDFLQNSKPIARDVECPRPGSLNRPQGDVPLRQTLGKLENDVIRDALVRFKGNKKKASEYLGISRSYLYKKLEELQ